MVIMKTPITKSCYRIYLIKRRALNKHPVSTVES